MYPSRGTNRYGQQQPYSSQSSYTPQNLSAAALLGGTHQEAELTRYRAAAATAAGVVPNAQHYGGQYGSVYGSSAQQGSATANLEGRNNYGSSMAESPKYGANEYVPSSSRSYGQKLDQLYSERMSEYPSAERRQYSDRHSAYLGRDLTSETADRYVESAAFGHDNQSKLYDRMEQATVLRQEEMLKARTLQAGSVEGGARQADYLAARTGVRLPAQDPVSYAARVDLEPRSLSMLGGSSYGGQHTSSILGAAPQRSVDDLVYTQSSSNPGYGVSLPPGRDYGAGKRLHGTAHELDYRTSMLGRVDQSRLDDRKDDRATYAREMERREKDRDYLREREKEREKDRLREREREREREQERERERERERQREREREREREWREKEREREHKRVLELKQRTPPRVSRDRRGSSLVKDVRPLKRESPRREVVHRHHSPVKEKRREYDCKVFSFSFVEAERDYLSLDKRYPRLYVSPECSKVSIHWPKKNLHLSLYTPVSFEHDFIEDTPVERKESPTVQGISAISQSGAQDTIWNAKIILMSGLSENSVAELSSERLYDDRVPHFCNMLRFAVLKQNNSLRAIGGPWEIVDGGEPSDDDSLIRTALRYAKDATNLDLRNCQHWNRFLEIHYDRVGKDGLFSHKEVTVLYVPDLSECLPSLDTWREQWLSHKKAVSERERLNSLKKEISGDKEEDPKDKKKPQQKDGVVPKKEPSSSGQPGDDYTKEKVTNKSKDNLVSEKEKVKDEAVENKDAVGNAEEKKNVVKKAQEGNSSVGAKTGKKKIIKRIVKRKVAKKKDVAENAAEQSDPLDKEDAGGKNANSEADAQKDRISGTSSAVKTFVRKKIVKKAVKSAAAKDESSTPALKMAEEPESIEDSTIVKPERSNQVAQEGATKSVVKKKVVKRVPKRKVITANKSNNVGEDDAKGEETEKQPEHIECEQKEEAADDQTNSKIITKGTKSSKMKPAEKSVDTKDAAGSALESNSVNKKVSQSEKCTKVNEKEVLKGDKGKKVDTGNKSRSTSLTAAEKKRSDEPPRHPGLILQTRGSKVSKLQSLSLSLDSLLDYSDQDIEESKFELSVFAESFYEMLQYEMGCRLLSFLQKLRIKFVAKRNQRKRQNIEAFQKEDEENPSSKRIKTEKTDEGATAIKTENSDDTRKDDDNIIKEEIKTTEQTDEPKKEDEIEEEEPEEDTAEDEEMPDASIPNDSIKEEPLDTEKKAADDSDNKEGAQNKLNEKLETPEQTPETTTDTDASNKDKLTRVEAKTKEPQGGVDKELLKAFRFFDRNRAGYLRVEDLRLVIHNLGMLLSHRDVKELVQSALLESNTGRDDKILYEKLVKMSDI